MGVVYECRSKCLPSTLAPPRHETGNQVMGVVYDAEVNAPSTLPAVVPKKVMSLGPHTCVRAENFLNAQYTVPVGVGTPEQSLRCVMDSGSFELLLAASECNGCGKHRKFDRSVSSTIRPKTPAQNITTLFGQGKVVSKAFYETARVGSLSVRGQSVLLMQENELRDFDDAAYDGVVGLGVSGLARSGDYDASLLNALGVDSFSICFGQYDEEPGRVEFGTPDTPNFDAEYVQLPVLGDDHWAVELSGVAVVHPGGARKEIGGCSIAEGSCNAIVDSGTSLIAAPRGILNDAGGLLDSIGDIDPKCQGIHNLPTIEVRRALRMLHACNPQALRFHRLRSSSCVITPPLSACPNSCAPVDAGARRARACHLIAA